MTIYGWDTSHYDGVIFGENARRAKADGIVFATAKVGEGRSYDDPLDAINLSAFMHAGIEFIGGYYVPRSGDVTPQVDNCIRLADRDEPWWRDHAGWFWQTDLERWEYDSVPAATGIAFGKQLRSRTGKAVVLYASHGQYGNQLTDWDGPLWNADYVSPKGDDFGFKALYPGDAWMPSHGGGTWRGGWAPYSNQTPAILQYTSQATIAGYLTCDANAFRGSADDFRKMIGGDDVALTDEEIKKIADKTTETVWQWVLAPPGPNGSGYNMKDHLIYAETDSKRAADQLAKITTAVDYDKLAEALANKMRPVVSEVVRQELDKTHLQG